MQLQRGVMVMSEKENVRGITLETIKQEIDNYIKNGGNIDEKSTGATHYKHIIQYIRKLRKKGEKINVSDVYRLCDVKTKSRRYNELEMAEFFSNNMDEKGYIDEFIKTEEGKDLLKRVIRRAYQGHLDRNLYLAVFFNARVKNYYENIDEYIRVQQEIAKFAKRFGKHNISSYTILQYDKNLYNMLVNLNSHFPLGKITVSEMLNYFGYNFKEINRTINEDLFLEELHYEYPNKEIKNLTQNKRLFKSLLVVSLRNHKLAINYLRENDGLSMI